jgi:hypothetical protein
VLKSLLLALAGVTIPSTLLSAVLLAAPTEMYQGKIAAIGDKTVMLISREGDNLSFAVAADCMIMLDGKQVSLGMLGVGHMVRIAATLDGTTRVAKQIDARSLE